MKKVICIFTLAAMLMLAACGCANEAPTEDVTTSVEASKSTEPEVTEPINQTPEAYFVLLSKYADALSEKAGGGTLMNQSLSYVMADCYGNAPLERIGYAVLDINQDGVLELLVGTMPVIDDGFYGKLIFDLYTLDRTGACIKVFSSSERNRYYYAGSGSFANVGSGGAAFNYVTTLKLEDGELVDMTFTTDPADYEQMELLPFGEWESQ